MNLKNRSKIFHITTRFAKPLALILVPVVLSCLSACSNHYEGGSVASLLDLADKYISAGDSRNAFSALEQAERQSTTTYDRLGVYKRYLHLGDYGRAEKTIKKAIKKEKESQEGMAAELNAVYGNLLIEMDRTGDALKITKNLSGTKYGSIYAEAFLKNTIESGKSANELFGGRATKEDKAWKKDPSRKNEVFYDSRFSKIYNDAYLGTGKYRWNWNAATVCMKDGLYQDGVAFYPGRTVNMDDALFWGLVFFDGGLYSESLAAMVPHENEDFPAGVVMQYRALLADNYYILSMDEEAEKVRNQLLAMDAGDKNFAYEASHFIPQAYVNSANYARGEDDQVLEYKRLAEVVSLFPEYMPGLASYGEFALRRQERPADDMMTAHIRAAGLSTRVMDREREIPDISVQNALELIRAAEEKEPTPELMVLEQQLVINAEKGMENSKKASKVWPLLEKNEIGPSLYPKEIMRFALITLLESGKDADAKELFERYEHAAHTDQNELDQKKRKKIPKFIPSEHLDELELWECEMAAWFAVYSGDIKTAESIYDHIIKLYSGRSPVNRASGQNEAVVNASINMGNIYSGNKLYAVALEHLNRASARASDPQTKAEILYRMGKQSYYMHDYHSAIRSLKYSLTLDPTNNKTRFMLQQAEKGDDL